MRLCVLDFESFYDPPSYSLSSMTTEAYVRDPRFSAHGVGIKLGDKDPVWVPKKSIPAVFARVPWDELMVLCQNTTFDGAILSWIYGVVPGFYLDTMSMFRALYPDERRASLGAMAKRLQIGEKGSELAISKGKRTLTAYEENVLAGYCAYNQDSDINLTLRAFNKLKKGYPLGELRLIDANIRLYTEPILRLNANLIQEAYDEEVEAKRQLMEVVDADKETLASNDKFASLLVSLGIDPPKKISPAKLKKNPSIMDFAELPPVGLIPKLKKRDLEMYHQAADTPHPCEVFTYAFGKSDEEFKKLADSEDPIIAALIAARMGVKSTLKETRAMTFLKIALADRTLPVPYNYYGGHTGRLSGKDYNLQNLTRGSKLRLAIEAPEGHVLGVADFNAIEARTVAWLAGQTDMVEAFRRGEDVYSKMATQIYGRTIDRNLESDFIEGFTGKAVILGCFAAGTKVRARRGWVNIEDIRSIDSLWDGVEWVSHKGVIPQGEKECLTAHGLTATPDHKILLEGEEWVEWSEVLINPSRFQSAINTANSPSSIGFNTPQTGGFLQGGIQSCNVPAAGKAGLIGAISSKDELHDVIHAQNFRAPRPISTIGGMKILSQMRRQEPGCLIEYQHVSPDATTLRTVDTTNTEDEESSSTNYGERIGKGSSDTLLLSKVGITQNLNSTGKITRRGMNQETSVSVHDGRTCLTEEASIQCKKELQSSKQKCETYDIAFAGPRSRFTVLTEKGPIIVHNCGYSMSWKKFQSMIRIGMLGMKGFLFGMDVVDGLGLNLQVFEVQNKKDVIETLPDGADFTDHLVHCACAHAIVKRFRDQSNKVVDLWKDCQQAIVDMMAGVERQVGYGGVVFTEKNALRLPNGMRLLYTDLQAEQNGRRIEYTKLGKKCRERVYGGLITENLTQALARIIMTNAWLKCREEGLRVVMTTHDELIICSREERAEQEHKRLCEIMSTSPTWAPDLPMKAKGGWAKNYSK